MQRLNCMREQLLHTIMTAAIAAAAALFGFWRLAGIDVEWWVVGASVAMWIALGNLFIRSEGAPIEVVYFGLLSPLLGCLMAAPPWSFLVVSAAGIFTGAWAGDLAGRLRGVAVFCRGVIDAPERLARAPIGGVAPQVRTQWRRMAGIVDPSPSRRA